MISLGPRASILLGFLISSAKTPEELTGLVSRAVQEYADGLDLDWLFADAIVSLRSLADGGEPEIRRLLARLEECGFAQRVVLDGHELWTTTK